MVILENQTLANFIICSSTNKEAFELEKECNITESATIHIITDEVSEPSLFQKMSGESDMTVAELNEGKTVSRILIGPESQAIIDEALSRGWNENIWSGIVLSDTTELAEYRKVYPTYTS